MSWILEKTGKFLDQIDQVAADQLQAERRTSHAKTSDRYSNDSDEEARPSDDAFGLAPSVSATQSVSATPSAAPKAGMKESIMDYLNSPRAGADSPAVARISASDPTYPVAPKPVAAIEAQMAARSGNMESQAAEENRLLRQEIDVLTDEVASFAARIRSTQDTLSDTRKDLEATQRKLARAHAARRSNLEREEELQRDVAEREQQILSLQKQVVRLTEKAGKAAKEKESLLNDQATSSAAQGRALEAMRLELQALKQDKANDRQTVAAVEESKEMLLSEIQQENATLVASLTATQERLDESQAGLNKQAAACQSAYNEVQTLQREYADYKAKATRILQVRKGWLLPS